MSQPTQEREPRIRWWMLIIGFFVALFASGGIQVNFDSTFSSVLIIYGGGGAVVGCLLLAVARGKKLALAGLILGLVGIVALLGGYYVETGVSPLDAEFWRKAISAGRW